MRNFLHGAGMGFGVDGLEMVGLCCSDVDGLEMVVFCCSDVDGFEMVVFCCSHVDGLEMVVFCCSHVDGLEMVACVGECSGMFYLVILLGNFLVVGLLLLQCLLCTG